MRIYNHFVRTSVVTFEEDEVPHVEMASRIETVQSLGMPWYAATTAQTLVGHACATPWKARNKTLYQYI